MAEKDSVFIGESTTKTNNTSVVKDSQKINVENTKVKDKE